MSSPNQASSALLAIAVLFLGTSVLPAQSGRWRKPDAKNHPLLAKTQKATKATTPAKPKSQPRTAAKADLRGFINTHRQKTKTVQAPRPIPASPQTARPIATAGQQPKPATSQVSQAGHVSTETKANRVHRAVFEPRNTRNPFDRVFAQVGFQEPTENTDDGGSSFVVKQNAEPATTSTGDGFTLRDNAQPAAPATMTPSQTADSLPLNDASTGNDRALSVLKQVGGIQAPANAQPVEPRPLVSQEVPDNSQPSTLVQPAPLSIESPASEQPSIVSSNVRQNEAKAVTAFPQPNPADQLVQAPEYNNRNCEQDGKECQVARNLLTKYSIRDISLNTSPRLFEARDPMDQAEKEKYRKANIKPREWRGKRGELLASGKLIDYKFEKVLVEQADGKVVKIAARQLGEDELCYLASWWEVPTQCLLPQIAYEKRSSTPITFSWKASAICGKPNYFENVQLERYGHTAGPVLQPLLSGAHFVGSIATLPYQAGINPPGECVYPLGYYRPGDCAPWLRPPIPWSVRGGLFQAAAVTGAAAIIP